MKLFSAATLEIRPLAENELQSTLEVYKQCEDFLTLGPVPFASMEMVQADRDHSKKENGVYCGIWNEDNKQIGVIDFIPEIFLPKIPYYFINFRAIIRNSFFYK